MSDSSTVQNLPDRSTRGSLALFLDQLAVMHHGEKLLAKALILVAKAAHSDDLKKLVEAHQKETEGHVKCIESVVESLEVELPERNAHAVSGMIEEAVLLMVKQRNSPHLDSALIGAARKIEHYEIASYGFLCASAKKMGLRHEFALLKSTLDQEKFAEALLSAMAEGAGPLPELVEKISLQKAGAKA